MISFEIFRKIASLDTEASATIKLDQLFQSSFQKFHSHNLSECSLFCLSNAHLLDITQWSLRPTSVITVGIIGLALKF